MSVVRGLTTHFTGYSVNMIFYKKQVVVVSLGIALTKPAGYDII